MENIEQSQEKKLTTISSLIAQIQNDANNYLDSQLKKIGLSEITTSHGFILFVLSQNKNTETQKLEPMTMKEISKRIDKNKSTMTVLIDKLLKYGYIIREKNNSDTRYSYISLSEKGKSFIPEMERISKELSEKFYNGFSEDEKKTVFYLLDKILSNFN
ncbi:MAG: MarR family transcriptional regulator [Spirochaetaceae bacterium]|nr:MarR family transcriptional regulator [Spirochaetaceae bacterium]MBQ7904794.1 MarR family transcriptional regulator [Spirochaetaceae bacterium]